MHYRTFINQGKLTVYVIFKFFLGTRKLRIYFADIPTVTTRLYGLKSITFPRTKSHKIFVMLINLSLKAIKLC